MGGEQRGTRGVTWAYDTQTRIHSKTICKTQHVLINQTICHRRHATHKTRQEKKRVHQGDI